MVREAEQLRLLHQMSRFLLQGALNCDQVLYTVLTCVTAGPALGFNRALLLLLDALGKILAIRPTLPIIINSAFSSYKDSFMSWVADAYVIKSSDLTELKTRIRETLTQRAVAGAGC